ncbi:SH3 domain-binding protein 2 isoform X2 [Gadus macrocephalus]|uniref:SH3 domain-binding protein 2 isoform X2 n=1 Tax=Gadus macrocephalus TaxID=80720 RepID=UPI0028CB1F6C|nr:SH3 domain-binding protein 2 isoform X2 [Gadus macrocephalus]
MSTVSVRKKSLVSRSHSRMCVQKQIDLTSMASLEMCWPAPMRAIGAQNLLTMPGGVSTCGYLHKKGGSQFSLMKWPLRYIILHKGCVYYFKSSTSAAPQGAFSLNGYNRVMRAAEETTSNNVFPFKIVHFSKKHRIWLFSAASEEERRKWMKSLRKEIDHYNDRRESLITFETDSDDESFYGSIERPMDIKHSEDHTEDDYMEEDEDDDEEDYVKPDSSPTSTVVDSRSFAGRPNVPPPAYPPPPVPAPPRSLTSDPSYRFSKGPTLPPPVPPPNKLSPSFPPRKTPPPFLPPSILKDPGRKGAPSSSLAPPLPPPPNTKRLLLGRGLVLPEQRPSEVWKTPPAIGKLLEHCMLNDPPALKSPRGLPGNQGKLSPPPLPPPIPAPCPPSSHPARPAPPTHPPQPRTGQGPASPKPPPAPPNLAIPPIPPTTPIWTPTTPIWTPTTPTRTPITPTWTPITPTRSPTTPTWTPTTTTRTTTMPTRAPTMPTRAPTMPSVAENATQESPDGQSFRTSVDEMPETGRRKSGLIQRGEDSDDDYENVQLPDSVFIDTTETSSVEKLFKETSSVPHDGLYGIRNSGTKTNKVLVVWDVSVGKARNYRLFEEDKRVFLDIDVTFLSLEALVEHYHTHPLPHHGSLCLQTPYGDAHPR